MRVERLDRQHCDLIVPYWVGSIQIGWSAKLLFGGHPRLFQQTNQGGALARGQHIERRLHIGGVLPERLLDEIAPRGRQSDDAGPAIIRISGAADEFPRFQAVDGRRYGTAGEQDLLADHVHRLRTFVKQKFQDGKIGKSEAEARDAVDGVLLDGFGSFPQDQPDTDAAGVGVGIGMARRQLASLYSLTIRRSGGRGQACTTCLQLCQPEEDRDQKERAIR